MKIECHYEGRASGLELALGNLAAFVKGRASDKKAIARMLRELIDEASWQAAGGARVRHVSSPVAYPIELELDPTATVGAPCTECRQPHASSHLGTCSRSVMNGGSGLVGYVRKVVGA